MRGRPTRNSSIIEKNLDPEPIDPGEKKTGGEPEIYEVDKKLDGEPADLGETNVDGELISRGERLPKCAMF